MLEQARSRVVLLELKPPQADLVVTVMEESQLLQRAQHVLQLCLSVNNYCYPPACQLHPLLHS